MKYIKQLLPIALLVVAVIVICFIMFPVKVEADGTQRWDIFFGWAMLAGILTVVAIVLFVFFMHNASEDRYGHNMNNHFPDMDPNEWDLKIPFKK